MVGTLSNRELEVARMAVSGLSNKQIADALFLSIRTVENHMSRALQKLGCANRGELGAVLGLASREPSPPPTPAPPPAGTPTGEAAQAAARAASVPTPRESREGTSAPV
ncbi:response regulator transcription factor [Cellulomonas denverensis]|uniref:Response regulator transcription factor n=2 Tax=Cellulomonas denverensis TaxID=264297 RepID=A0A7X6R0K9_9CELL|nr:response regulator transcription factor [Cellulomonas denverensis]